MHAMEQQKTQYTIKFRMLNPEGKYEWIQNNTSATYDSNGNVLRRIVQARNITKQVELENELRKQNEDKDQFIRILGHDLRNPFNALIGFSNLLLENLHNYDIKMVEDLVRIINQTSINTYEMLDQIMLWIKSQSGKLELEIVPFNLQQEIIKVVRSVENVAVKKDIKIEITGSDSIFLSADINIFKTVLRNLISNAIKFTDLNDRIIVSTEKKDQQVLIAVADNGIGMEDDVKAKIWDINYTSSGTKGEQGAGFGLNLCKKLIERHNGQIWVESTPGKGSKFIVSLPA